MVTISCFFCGGTAAWAVYADSGQPGPPRGASYLCDRCRAALKALVFERLRLSTDSLTHIVIASLTTDASGPLAVEPGASLDSSAALSEIERLLGG